MKKPFLADVMPGHPTARHPLTRQPVRAIGLRRNGDPIWPVAGGSQPLGVPGTAQPASPALGVQHPPAAQQFVPGLGGAPAFAPGALPMAQPPQQGAGQPYPGQVGGQAGPFVVPQPPYGQPQGVMPGQPYTAGQPAAPQQQFPFAFPALGQPQGQPGGQQVNGHQPQGQQPAGGQQQGQPGQGQPQGQQQSSGGGQQQTGGGTDGAWDKPYPQKPLADMTLDEQNAYWKYHNRKLEDRIRSMGDYEQVKAQLAQLQQMTQTEWQRAVLEAENRGRTSAMEQAAGQMVAVAFQGAANQRMTPDQIHAQLARLDAKSFVHNGQVDIAAIHAYVDTIAPARPNGLVPLLPNQPQQQGLPLPQVQLGGQPGLQPGQPGYGQQPLTGPLGQQPQQQYGQPGVQPGWQAPPVYQGQVVPGYGQGQVPTPGVPSPYQPATYPTQPVVQAAGMVGLPHLGQQSPGLPGVTDFGQGPAVPGAPANPLQAGSAMAAARHGRTRSQQLAATRG